MHGFINSPALAKLVALQMVDEELRAKRGRKTRTPLRARLAYWRPARGTARARSPRVSPSTSLVEEAR